MRTASKAPANLLSDLVAAAPRGLEAQGRAVTVGLVGRGIGASRSPAMHQREGARLGLRYTYTLIDLDRMELEDSALAEIVARAEQLGFAGLNVTHPFKQSVIPFLTDLSPEASAIGAVNTVVFQDGRRTGHNTDCWGFAESFRDGMAGCSLANVLQFGAGGAGAAVAHALLDLGVERLAVYDAVPARAAGLAETLGKRFGKRITALREAEPAFAHAAGIVNTTPVGMAKYPGIPFPPALLSARHWVAEIIYFPVETALLKLAREQGCRTLSGIGMAVYQAVRAFALFTGAEPDRYAMRRFFEEGGP